MKPTEAQIRQSLTPTQCQVTQRGVTERPFSGIYNRHFEPGIYVDIVSGEPLFCSLDKFDAGCGWPSFSRPIGTGAVRERTDRSHGMHRIEVRGAEADTHLGHVFTDGPPTQGGLRFCINSAALRFVPLAALEAEGYAEHLDRFRADGMTIPVTETAILAGGCFWGMQAILRQIDGVLHSRVGYCGGETEKATYAAVKAGGTGHAEAVKIVFNPQRLSFKALLTNVFFRMHDPTTRNRQGNDVGDSYRSAIFYRNKQQKNDAEAAIRAVTDDGRWPRPIVTTIEAARNWSDAEPIHQDYLERNPGGYTCHWLRNPE